MSKVLTNFLETPVLGADGKPVITKKGPKYQRVPIRGASKQYTELSKSFMTFVTGDSQMFLLMEKHPDELIKDALAFYAKLVARLGYEVNFTGGDGAISLAQLMTYIREKARKVTRVSNSQELIKDPGTIYRYEDVRPKKSGAFLEMINILTVQEDIDRYRFASGLLSQYLPVQFDAQKPLFAVVADSRSSGKSTAVRSTIRILTGEHPLELLAIPEDEAQFGGIKNMGNKFAIYDNLENVRPKELTTITLSITTPYNPSWIFGQSHARVPNNKTYWATFNSEHSINTDIVNRMVSIKMKDGHTVPVQEKAKVGEALIDMQKRAMEVRADALSIMRSAKINFNDPRAQLEKLGIEVLPHIKFQQWSYVMGIVLKPLFPEIEVFDFSEQATDAMLDETVNELDDFFESLFEKHQGPFFVIYNDILFDEWKEYWGVSSTGSHAPKHATSIKAMTSHHSKFAGSLRKYAIKKLDSQIRRRDDNGYIIKNRHTGNPIKARGFIVAKKDYFTQALETDRKDIPLFKHPLKVIEKKEMDERQSEEVTGKLPF